MKYGTALALHRAAFGCGAVFDLVRPKQLIEVMCTVIESRDPEALDAMDELWPHVDGPSAHLESVRRIREAWRDAGGGNPRRQDTGHTRGEEAAMQYAHRNANLKRLHFHSYSEYLCSGTWARIRAKMLASRPKCDFCGDRATQVHHSSYATAVLRGDTTVGLHVTCSACHRAGEFDGGKKVSPRTATRRMRSSDRAVQASPA